MAGKVLVNLATGLEDAERVLVAFLVATAALGQGKEVVVWTTKDAVRLGLPGEAKGVACDGCPPLAMMPSLPVANTVPPVVSTATVPPQGDPLASQGR